MKMEDLVTTDMEKTEVLSNLFASVFTGTCSSPVSPVTECQGRDWGDEVPLIIGEDRVQDHLRNLNVQVHGTQ